MRRTIQLKNFNKQKALVATIGLLALTGLQTMAQECTDYFTMKEGTVLSYVNYNPKGKVSGSNEMSFKKKTDTPEGMKTLFSTKLKDDKGEILHEGEFEVECKNGVLHFDAGQLLDPATMSAYESMEVNVTGDNLELPLHSADGTSLKDGGVKAVVSSGGMKIITLTVDVTNRKIEAHETIVTPAGSFKCIKYTYDSFSQAGFVKVNSSGIEWYNQELGTIRSESYDKNGKLTGYTVLESFSD
jgi:hypothetical protein